MNDFATFKVSMLLLLGLLFFNSESLPAHANQAVASVPVTATVEPNITATCDGYVSLGRILLGDTGNPSQINCTIQHNQPNGTIRITLTPNTDLLDLQKGEDHVTVRLLSPTVDKGILSGNFQDGFLLQKAPVGNIVFRTTVQLNSPLTSESSAGNYLLPINFLFSMSQ